MTGTGTAKVPAASAVSGLLRRSGFTRSTWGNPGVMFHDATTGYTAWRTFHREHPDQPYVAVQHNVHRHDAEETDWPELKAEMLARLREYAEALKGHGYHCLVRDRGEEMPWLMILTAARG